ncbi:N-acetylmuramoyl-L-alanine amidase [Nocardioides terrae]|uniref:N-acetylmuramoyl-L-alanine amidase n=1 Tax=Nocardioides terrae TaxID=574651 RepID=A0A1I1DMR3_9ACTN|nr:peptidoglycan recognition protein [Nocardioides terrae]SFB76275.1 N-acetylmuramoyl-L-alanine amidase [Nocardioides terrae]
MTLALAPSALTLAPSVPAPVAAATSLRLVPTGGGMAHLDLALAGRLRQRVDGGRRTATLHTTGYSMAGVTWTGARAPRRVSVRWTGQHGGWGRWRRLPLQTDLPGADEQGRTRGTQPVWTGRHRDVQVRLLGHTPRGLRLSLIDTGPAEASAVTPAARPAARSLAGATPAATGVAGVAARKPTHAPEPAMLSRRQWGADPSWRNGRPSYIRRIKQVHIHHTVSANDYAPGDVPGLLRGMYYYHTHSLGWFDIGYNFLVDRFGRTWVGRSGGASRAVRGAHTLGFNHESVGIALIGRFGRQAPSTAALRAVVRLAAWKLDEYGGHPRRHVRVFSRGSDRFPAGTPVTLQVIDGHRDTNETACPGTKLYEMLPWVRGRAGRRVHRFDP